MCVQTPKFTLIEDEVLVTEIECRKEDLFELPTSPQARQEIWSQITEAINKASNSTRRREKREVMVRWDILKINARFNHLASLHGQPTGWNPFQARIMALMQTQNLCVEFDNLQVDFSSS